VSLGSRLNLHGIFQWLHACLMPCLVDHFQHVKGKDGIDWPPGKAGWRGVVRLFCTFSIQPCPAQLPCTAGCQWCLGPGSTRACQTPAAVLGRASLDTGRLVSRIQPVKTYHHYGKTPPQQPGPIPNS
jgi:hypothetical protein